MQRLGFALAAALVLSATVCAQDHSGLLISADDTILEESADGGYHLWIKARPGLGSVLLTESSDDPANRAASYALRDPDPNTVNGAEKRLLNGEFLKKNVGIIDSSPERHPVLESAFHLYIPYVVEYGYPWSRHGQSYVAADTFINLMAFEKPYGDWTGAVRDNPFLVRLQREQVAVAEGPSEAVASYIPDTVESFQRIAARGHGDALFSPTKDTLIPAIGRILDDATGRDLDLVLALDTTSSMKDEMPILKEGLVPLVKKYVDRFERIRVGVLFYRDYYEQYLVKINPFVEDLAEVQAQINGARVHGGKGIPEAVHEALFSGIESYPWEAESKLIVLIGDAPPHPMPLGRITEEMVYARAVEANVKLYTIILPP